MRIEAYNQIQQVYKASQVSKPQAAAKTGTSDQLQISSFGKDIQTVKAALLSAPDMREDLVSSIKSRIQDGTYEVSTESFADKLLQKYAEMR